MVDESDEAKIARLEEQVKHLGQQQDEMKQMLAEQSKQLAAIAVTLAQARGGWRVFLLIGGAFFTAGGTIVGCVVWALQHLQMK